MSFRRHILTGEPIVFAPERAGRPGAFTGASNEVERCPFCPGHEEDTPPEIVRIGSPWRARVFPNKHPPVPGAEVIVESSDHAARFEDIEHVEDLVRLYVDRYRAHGDAAYTAVFRNDGAAAGSSIAHVHSQVVPVPFVPQRIERELAGFDAGCPLCGPLEHVIREGQHFSWIAPSASWMPYQQWLIPKRHVAEMSAFGDDELRELAGLLRTISTATKRVANAFNWAFINFPRSANAHCYLDMLPRMTTIAGFELGTGTFVEIIDPAAAVDALR